MNRYIVFLAAFAAAAPLHADTLTIMNKTYTGSFEGYEDGIFVFKTDQGETLKEKHISQLDLEYPLDIKIQRKTDTAPVSAKLTQYASMKFILEQDGKADSVFAKSVKTVTVHRPAPTAGGTPRAATSDNAPIPRINTANIESLPNRTPSQDAALTEYKAAREAYDTFLARSSELVAAMDAARGGKRESILNELRLRKNEEQPIKNRLLQAMESLQTAFQ